MSSRRSPAPMKTQISYKTLMQREMITDMMDSNFFAFCFGTVYKVRAAGVAVGRTSGPERALFTYLQKIIVETTKAHRALNQQIIDGKSYILNVEGK